MNITKFSILILILFLKTGNVLSSESIFNVNNIKLNDEFYINKEKSINNGFLDGFDKLIKRILLQKDYKNLKQTNLKEIKDLVLHFQIEQPKRKNSKNKVFLNLLFDKSKINNFFYEKNIKYSYISNTEIVVLPILIEKDNFFVYRDNYFYNNWIKKDKKNSSNELIEYVLPTESLEVIEKIKEKKGNITKIKINEVLSGYEIKNSFFIATDISNKKVNVFLKGNITKKEIVKNFSFNKEGLSNKDLFDQIMNFLKIEIEELIKSQNTIDLTTPNFLNLNLKKNKNNDLLVIQNVLKEIDLIDNFNVQEFGKNFANIKIKFYGSISSISERFDMENLKLYQSNNEWNILVIK